MKSQSSADLRQYSVIIAALVTGVGAGVLLWAAHQPPRVAKMNDFYREAWPAYAALSHGHLLGFFRLGPAYLGSLAMRAPVALIPSAWSGSARDVYIASALPCVVAMAAFCTWLAVPLRGQRGVTWASRLAPAAFCVLNPFTIVALLGGHPEEILGAVLCVVAVVMATRGSATWAGVVAALAVINKAWAIVAVPVVLVALPGGHRRAIIAMAVTATSVMVPLTLLHGAGISAGAVGVQTGTIFNPPQLLWWFGPKSWIAAHARFTIVAVAAASAAGWYWRGRRREAAMPDALLLLALVLLLRAALDPWNNIYYHVPFLFALIAYEVRAGKAPLLTLAYTLALLIVTPIGGVPHMSYDVRAAAYAAVVLPTVAWLSWRLYGGSGAGRGGALRRRWAWMPGAGRADEATAP